MQNYVASSNATPRSPPRKRFERHITVYATQEVLTGEACLIGARYLCDLDERGARIVRAMLGLPRDCKLAGSWNSSGRIGPHVASVKLPTDLFDQLAVFCLFDAGAKHVIVTRDHGVHGVAEARLDAPGGAWETVAETLKLH